MSRVGVPTLWSWTGRWAFCLPFKCQSSTQSVGVVGKICEDLMVSHGFPTKFAKLHSKFDLGRGAIRLWQSSGFGGLPPSKVSFEVWVLRKLCKPTKRWTSFRRSPLLTTVLERQTVAVAVRCSQTWTVRLRWIAPWLSRNGHWWKLWKLFVHSWCLDWSNTKVCPFGWRRSWCYHQDALQAEGSTWHEMAPNGRRVELVWRFGHLPCLDVVGISTVFNRRFYKRKHAHCTNLWLEIGLRSAPAWLDTEPWMTDVISLGASELPRCDVHKGQADCWKPGRFADSQCKLKELLRVTWMTRPRNLERLTCWEAKPAQSWILKEIFGW